MSRTPEAGMLESGELRYWILTYMQQGLRSYCCKSGPFMKGEHPQ